MLFYLAVSYDDFLKHDNFFFHFLKVSYLRFTPTLSKYNLLQFFFTHFKTYHFAAKYFLIHSFCRTVLKGNIEIRKLEKNCAIFHAFSGEKYQLLPVMQTHTFLSTVNQPIMKKVRNLTCNLKMNNELVKVISFLNKVVHTT